MTRLDLARLDVRQVILVSVCVCCEACRLGRTKSRCTACLYPSVWYDETPN